jgi:hypothetical protein
MSSDQSETINEVTEDWPTPCQCCGKSWVRIGFMAFQLTCECPIYVPVVAE